MTEIELSRHIDCDYYTTDNSPFQTALLTKGDEYTCKAGGDYILLFIEGTAAYIWGDSGKEEANKPFFCFLGTEEQIRIVALQDRLRISTFRFDRPNKLCSTYSVNMLKMYAPSKHKFMTLPMKEALRRTVESAVFLYEDHLRCKQIFAMKLREIFFIISAYYESKDLGVLLAPLLRREIDFKEFVTQNFLRCETVQDLADLRGQNIRLFKRDFQAAFNMPPYAWMLQQKAKLIDERLADPTVPLSEIIRDFRFSSPSHLTVFCRRQFNMTPTQRRRLLIREEAERRAEERRKKYPYPFHSPHQERR